MTNVHGDENMLLPLPGWTEAFEDRRCSICHWK